MGNCLKTQLKESVNNNSLDIFGQLMLKLGIGENRSMDGDQYWFQVKKYVSESDPYGGSCTLNLKDCKAYTSQGVLIKGSTIVNASIINILPNDEFGYVYISNKYEISNLMARRVLNNVSVKYCSNLLQLRLFRYAGNNSIEDVLGNTIDSLKLLEFNSALNMPATSAYLSRGINLESLTLTDVHQATGHLSDFGSCRKLTTLVLAASGTAYMDSIKGSLESLAVAMYGDGTAQNGRTSGTLTFTGNGDNHTFHNAPLSIRNIKLKFSSSSPYVTIADNNDNTLATYDGSTWAYNN